MGQIEVNQPHNKYKNHMGCKLCIHTNEDNFRENAIN